MFLYFRTCPSKWTGFVSVAAHWAYVHFSVSGMKNHVIQFNLSSNAKGPFYVGMKKNTNLYYFKQFFYVETKSWQKEVNFRKENKVLISLTGYGDALHASGTHGQSSEIHRQSPHADRKVKK